MRGSPAHPPIRVSPGFAPTRNNVNTIITPYIAKKRAKKAGQKIGIGFTFQPAWHPIPTPCKLALVDNIKNVASQISHGSLQRFSLSLTPVTFLIPWRAVLDRLVILLVKNVEAQVPAWIQEAEKVMVVWDLLHHMEEFIWQSLDLQILLHVCFLYGFRDYWYPTLHGPRETNLDTPKLMCAMTDIQRVRANLCG